jgi:hypothetical protein
MFENTNSVAADSVFHISAHDKLCNGVRSGLLGSQVIGPLLSVYKLEICISEHDTP